MNIYLNFRYDFDSAATVMMTLASLDEEDDAAKITRNSDEERAARTLPELFIVPKTNLTLHDFWSGSKQVCVFHNDVFCFHFDSIMSELFTYFWSFIIIINKINILATDANV